MRSAFILILFFSSNISIHAQQKYTIRGKIDRLSKSENLYVDQNRTTINSDGSFEISGEVTEPHMALVHTDSSGADGLWLEAGTYTVDFRETMPPALRSILFRAQVMDGPRNARLLSDFQTHIAYNSKGGQKELATRFLDSVFQYFPNAGPLPYILVEAQYYFSDTAMERYIGKLTPEMRNSDEIHMIEGQIKRNTKIRTEKSFEDFSMNTPDGGTFRLSSLKGKKVVLLDFWAKECAPCRAAHPGLIALYKKYKDKGLEIVSVSLDTERDAWLDAIEKDRIGAWINVSELKGFESSLVKDYFIPYIPFRFLLDGDRTIIRTNAGGDHVSNRDIEEALNKVK